MEIKKEDIAGTFKLKDGNKYIFLIDETIYKEDSKGNLTKIELNKRNLRRIGKDMGRVETDVER